MRNTAFLEQSSVMQAADLEEIVLYISKRNSIQQAVIQHNIV